MNNYIIHCFGQGLGWVGVGVGVGLVDGGARQLQRSARAICGFHKSPEQGLNLSES